jgi:hypothetical protein
VGKVAKWEQMKTNCRRCNKKLAEFEYELCKDCNPLRADHKKRKDIIVMCNVIKFRSKFEQGVIKVLKNMGDDEAIARLENRETLTEYLEKDTLLGAYLRDKEEFDEMEGVSFADWNTARIEILKEESEVIEFMSKDEMEKLALQLEREFIRLEAERIIEDINEYLKERQDV